jgi:hypothetical protein
VLLLLLHVAQAVQQYSSDSLCRSISRRHLLLLLLLCQRTRYILLRCSLCVR